MTRAALIAVAAAGLVAGSCASAAAPRSPERAHEPVVGLPCENCEAVFDGMPASIEAHTRIAPADERGQPMRIVGSVVTASGQPAPGVIVYAYHTDDHGVYPPGSRERGAEAGRHGRLRAWARTDAAGRYRFDTIRPAGYPGTEIPAHVHMHVIEPGRCTYYIDDIHFDDDPRLPASERQRLDRGRGGSGIVTPRRDADGTWIVTRDIVLGKGVPGYPGVER
jgi:protocatechuate 3,4-dioxygenase beta subunit